MNMPARSVRILRPPRSSFHENSPKTLQNRISDTKGYDKEESKSFEKKGKAGIYARVEDEMNPKIIELNKAHEMLKNAYKNYQQIYQSNKGETL